MPCCASIQPDAVLILGDTNSCLAAISAKRQKIPVFHMEAGNRCFDQRVPEEINRKIVDHISDINLPYSTISRDYLLREGLPPDRVIKTGSPMYEVLHHYLPQDPGIRRLVAAGFARLNSTLWSAPTAKRMSTARSSLPLVDRRADPAGGDRAAGDRFRPIRARASGWRPSRSACHRPWN